MYFLSFFTYSSEAGVKTLCIAKIFKLNIVVDVEL